MLLRSLLAAVRGFRGVVDLFGCPYADVDRRSLHSNRGVPVGQRYDAIDLEPGCQRLCGNDALDDVRFRHADPDVTRAARQQDLRRAAKDQVSTSALIDDRVALARASRLVVAENAIDGQFHGVQGATWRTPPLLAEPSAKRRVGGRTLELFRAGRRLRFVAWRTDRAAYWISNALGLKLSNDEMLALAASLTTT